MSLVKEKKVPQVLGKYKIMIRVLRPDKRRRDIDNLSKAACDFLQYAKIIEDDCLCEAIYCKWVISGPEFRINLYPVRGNNELPRRPKKALQGSQKADAETRNPGASPRDVLAAAYVEARSRNPKARIGFRKR
jgi:hypothetical protein